jgi:hypothetical protein
MYQVRSCKIVTTVTERLSALTLNVSGMIVQNSYHSYREVVGTNSVNVSGKVIQNSYHGYRKIVGTNSVNVSGKIV